MDNMRSERGGSNTELEAAAFRKLLEHFQEIWEDYPRYRWKIWGRPQGENGCTRWGDKHKHLHCLRHAFKYHS